MSLEDYEHSATGRTGQPSSNSISMSSPSSRRASAGANTQQFQHFADSNPSSNTADNGAYSKPSAGYSAKSMLNGGDRDSGGKRYSNSPVFYEDSKRARDRSPGYDKHHQHMSHRTSSSNRHPQHHQHHRPSEDFGNGRKPLVGLTIDPELDKDRERFAGDYTSICLKNLNKNVDDSILRETLYGEFSRFGQFNVKIVNNRKNSSAYANGGAAAIEDTRIAFINFNNHDEAREAKRAKMGHDLYGYPLHIEPVFRSRSNSGFGATLKARSRSPVHHSGGRFNSSSGQSSNAAPSRGHQDAAGYNNRPGKHYQTNEASQRLRSRSRSRTGQRPRSPSLKRSRTGSRSRSVSKTPATGRNRNGRSRSTSRNAPHHVRSQYEPTRHYSSKQNNSTPPPPPPPAPADTYRRSSRSLSPLNNYSSKDGGQRSTRRPSISPTVSDRRRFQFTDDRAGHGPQPPHRRSPSRSPPRYKETKGQNGGGDSMRYEPKSGSASRRFRSPSYNSGDRHVKPAYRSRSRSPAKNYVGGGGGAYKPGFGRDAPGHRVISPSNNSSSSYYHSGEKANTYHRREYSSPSVSKPGGHFQHSNSRRSPSPPFRNNHSHNNQHHQSASSSSGYHSHRRTSYSPTHSHNSGGGSGGGGGGVHHLNDDEREATRTLFIGNLDYDIHCNDLKHAFDKYGYIEEIDIKRLEAASHNGGSGGLKAYAFIKFENMDMASHAKAKMNGKLIGKNECKIGYGKVQPTNCLWVAGFNGKTHVKDIESHFTATIVKFQRANRDRKQSTERIKIDWKPGDKYGYVLTSCTEYAEEIRFQFRGKSLPNGCSDKLRIDFAEAVKFYSTPPPPPSSSSREKERRHETDASKRPAYDQETTRGQRQYEYGTRGSREREVARRESFSPKSSAASTSSRNHGGDYYEQAPSRGSSTSATRPGDSEQQATNDVFAYRAKKFKSNDTVSPQPRGASPPKPAEHKSPSKSEPVAESESKDDADFKLGGAKKPAGKSAFETIIITTTNDSRRVDKLPAVATANNGHAKRASDLTRQSSSTEVAEAEKLSNEPAKKNDLEPSRKDERFSSNGSASDRRQVEGSVANSQSASSNSSAKAPSGSDQSRAVLESPRKASSYDSGAEEPSSTEREINLGDEPLVNRRLLKNNIVTVDHIRELTDSCWSGIFVLKKHAFPTKFYMLSGSEELARQHLPINGHDSSAMLRICQRLRLDSNKIDELEKKLYESCASASQTSVSGFSKFKSELNYSILIALPTDINAASPNLSPVSYQLQQQIEQNQLQHRAAHYLLQYLNQKSAAGVIPLSDEKVSVVLHAFTPNCQFSARVLRQILPSLKPSPLEADIASSSSSPNELDSGKPNDANEYLIIVILRT